MFRKTQHNRIFQDLVGQIQEAILDGRLQPGDKLPSQRELVAMFQTSRASIREALRVLEQKGLIEVKLGVSGGAVVRNAGTGPITESLKLLLQQKQVSVEHLVEFRECIEGDIAACAARRAETAAIQQLEAILAQAKACLEETNALPHDFIRADIHLHTALAEISGNPIFLAVTKMVHETILGLYDRFTLQDRDILEENFRDLCALVAAVKKGQAEKARRLALNHVRRFKQHLQTPLPKAAEPAPTADQRLQAGGATIRPPQG